MHGLNHIGIGQRSNIKEFKFEVVSLMLGFAFWYYLFFNDMVLQDNYSPGYHAWAPPLLWRPDGT